MLRHSHYTKQYISMLKMCAAVLNHRNHLIREGMQAHQHLQWAPKHSLCPQSPSADPRCAVNFTQNPSLTMTGATLTQRAVKCTTSSPNPPSVHLMMVMTVPHGTNSSLSTSTEEEFYPAVRTTILTFPKSSKSSLTSRSGFAVWSPQHLLHLILNHHVQ